MFKKSLVFVLAAALSFAALGCDDDDNSSDSSNDSGITEADCASKGMVLDQAKGACVAKDNSGDDSKTDGGSTDGGSTDTETPVAGADCDVNSYAGGCSADKMKRYYCGSDGKLVEIECASGGCVVNGNNSSACGSTGTACDASTYTPKCSDDGKTAQVCHNGVEKTWTCAETCSLDSTQANGVYCPKTSSGSDSSSTCGESFTPSCSTDGKTAQVCHNGVEKTWTCAETCRLDSTQTNGVYCPKTSSGGSDSGSDSSETLSDCAIVEAGQDCTKCTPVCQDGAAYLCNTKDGKTMKWENCDKTCSVSGTSVTCEANCTGEKVTTGGEAGNCCDPTQYEPTCSGIGATAGLRCSAYKSDDSGTAGVVKAWSCDEGVKCTISKDNPDYPKGYLSCNAN